MDVENFRILASRNLIDSLVRIDHINLFYSQNINFISIDNNVVYIYF